MREQAAKHGVEIARARVTELSRTSGHYSIVTERGWTAARTVLVATGVVNRRPPIPSDEAVARGLISYCPVCDGYEVTDKAVAVIGSGSRAFDETIFLRSYTKDLTLLSTDAGHGLTAEQQARLVDLGVKLLSGPLVSIDTDSYGGSTET
ncbi:thioredoxin reductase [Rhizobium sp. BK619]|uniref:NAD(P)/FAD-dependent oxidoreductase n=1 Tax=Rhizobium sp. BK619 TaxID=2586989 RepID=UPI0017E44175|nr:thioredoxin reductase [Rhizobium sp. BK619]